jgi:short chain dehydrogenase
MLVCHEKPENGDTKLFVLFLFCFVLFCFDLLVSVFSTNLTPCPLPPACGTCLYSHVHKFFNFSKQGISMVCNLEDLDDFSAIQRVMKVNFDGTAACAKYALQYLKASSSPRIAVVSSNAGKVWFIRHICFLSFFFLLFVRQHRHAYMYVSLASSN